MVGRQETLLVTHEPVQRQPRPRWKLGPHCCSYYNRTGSPGLWPAVVSHGTTHHALCTASGPHLDALQHLLFCLAGQVSRPLPVGPWGAFRPQPLLNFLGRRAAPVQRQLWDSAVLEQWATAIATPSPRRVHMGIARPHGMGTEFTWQALNESLKVWLARPGLDLIKVHSGPRNDGAGRARTSTAPAGRAAGRP